MFNPQRKSKPSDIFMQEKAFKLHLDKVRSIRVSHSPTSPRNEWTNAQLLQQKYLKRLQHSKQEVKSRLNNQVYGQNRRLFKKLVVTDRRPQQHPEVPSEQRHFNSYFSSRKQTARIRGDNCAMVQRMIQQTATIPTLEHMQRDFRQSKRYEKMGRRLPAILRHQLSAKKELIPGLSQYDSNSSLTHSSRSRAGRGSWLKQHRAATLEIRHIEQALVQKQ